MDTHSLRSEPALLMTVVSFMMAQVGPSAPDLISQETQPRTTTKGHIRNQAQKTAVTKAEIERGLHILYCRVHNEKVNGQAFGAFVKLEIKLHRLLYFRIKFSQQSL